MRGALDCVSAKISPTESTEVFTIHSYSAPDLTEKRRDVESQSNTGTRKQYLWTLLLNTPLLLFLVIVIVLFELGVIPSTKGGFYCNDPALAFPYRGDTVSNSILITGVLVMPIVVFLLTELTFTSSDQDRSKWFLSSLNSLWLFRSYCYGLVMNLTVVEVMKGLIGSPRPTFFDLCQPDVGMGSTCNATQYISTFECTSSYSWRNQIDSNRSFPSGHTSMSVYCGLFLAWYLQRRAFNWRHRVVVLVPIVQLGVISFAVVSSLTRITDNRHHWWDVLTGCAVGMLTVLYAGICLCKNFDSLCPRDDSAENTEDSRRTTKLLFLDEYRS